MAFLVSIALVSPVTADSVGGTLHAVTGRWQLDILLGYCAFLAGLLCAYWHVLSRITADDAQLSSAFRPAALVVKVVVPVMAVELWLADAAGDPHFFALPPQPWLIAYRLTVSAAVVWILGWLLWALWVVRTDPRSRATADRQIVACVCLLIATLLRAAFSAVHAEPNLLAWIVGMAGCSLYGRSLAWSWRRKVAAMAERLTADNRSRTAGGGGLVLGELPE